MTADTVPLRALDPRERLLLDEAGGPGSVLVVDSPALAEAAAEAGARVAAFCDDAPDHAALTPGVTAVEPGDPTSADQAWLVLPKSLDALDEYAGWAVRCGVTHLIVTARIKDLTRSATTVLERHFGQVRGSLGRNKARVLHATDPIPHPEAWRPTWPRTREVALPDGSTIEVHHHGATFAGGRLDPGTGLLLAALAGWVDERTGSAAPVRALDWGSGSGLLATWLARRFTGGDGLAASVLALDRSWAAASSTRLTAAANGVGVETLWTDGVDWLQRQPEGSLDLVVSNPPFHQGVAKDSGPTEQMLTQVPRVLAPGGQLWLVHNSHLPWARMLRDQRAGSITRMAQDRQFSVTRLLKD